MILKPYAQTLYVAWGNQLICTIILITNFQWWMIPYMLVSAHIFGLFSETSLHRYWTHKSYTTTRSKEHLLKLWAFLAGQGSVLSWVTVHRHHHAYEDTEQDPHSPLHIKPWKLLLGLFRKNYKNNLIFDLLKHPDKKYFIFENKYYWLLWTALWITAYLANFWLLFLITAGSTAWYIASNLVNIYAHNLQLGKKRFSEYPATNSLLLNLISGMGNHNNHHHNPKNYTLKIDTEIDLYGYFIEKFLKND
jgi:stearoyl-CoA desaturase (delta-9 desaturase)